MTTKNDIFKSLQDCQTEDPDFLISPCFDIGPNVELKEIPTTGEEYLLKVIKERQNYPVVTKCDEVKLKKQQTYFVTEPPPTISAPEKLKPTLEWQNIQVADFSDMRMYISQLKANKNYKKEWNLKFDQSNVSKWKEFLERNDPTVSSVVKFHQSVLDHAIEAIVELLDDVKPGDTIDHKTGQWIYSLMACMNQPLLSDTVSILRDLARKCGEIRSHLNQDDENAVLAAAPLNIFICLVSRYFRQHDLGD